MLAPTRPSFVARRWIWVIRPPLTYAKLADGSRWHGVEVVVGDALGDHGLMVRRDTPVEIDKDKRGLVGLHRRLQGHSAEILTPLCAASTERRPQANFTAA